MCGKADVGISHRMMDYAHEVVNFLVPMIRDDCCILFDLLQSTGLLPPPVPGKDVIGKDSFGPSSFTEPGVPQAVSPSEREHGGNAAFSHGDLRASTSKTFDQHDARVSACNLTLRPSEILESADGLLRTVAPELSFASDGSLLFFKSDSTERAFREWFAANHVLVRPHTVLGCPTLSLCLTGCPDNAGLACVLSTSVRSLRVACLNLFAASLGSAPPFVAGSC